MRLLEFSNFFLLLLYLIWLKPRLFAIRLLPVLALLVIIAHFILEGYRWQMIPLYALTFILAALTFFRLDINPTVSYLTLILLAFGVALPALLPVPNIPLPGGPYHVGASTYEMIDTSRKELYSGRDEPRRFMVQVWYPARIKATDVKAPWMLHANIYAPAIAKFIDMPSFFLDHLALVKIPAYKNAEIIPDGKLFPVILFSHGWKGFSTQNTGEALELASHGYIVIALQHTYGAITTVFPDGTIAPNNPATLLEVDYDPNYEVIARKLVDQWAGDLSFVLNQFQDPKSEAGSFFNLRMNFTRIGAYGHSTGGGAVIQFCGIDPRCKSVLGLDPFMRPVSEDVLKRGIPQPSFFMFSQTWVDDAKSRNNELFHEFIPNAMDNLEVIEILGTKHHDFSDLPLLSPIAPQLGLKGPLNGKRVVLIVNSYLLDFFEMTLNDVPSKFFGNSSPFSEVRILK